MFTVDLGPYAAAKSSALAVEYAARRRVITIRRLVVAATQARSRQRSGLTYDGR